ncbi:MAG: VWA domain-containing protein [Ignavibacteria bacterium]|jgi:hypothetical protein
MFKIINLLTFVLLLSASLWAQNKNDYNLDITAESENGDVVLSKSTSDFRMYESISNSKIELSMVTGGYFTVGLKDGMSASSLDDNCDISFGHPYALTSYPVISVNGEKLLIDELTNTLNFPHPVKEGNSLSVFSQIFDGLQIIFSLLLNDNGESVSLQLVLRNQGSEVKSVGGGIAFDPALGKWGDGYVKFEDPFVLGEFTIESDIPDQFEIWERKKSSKGIGINYLFDGEKASRLYGMNWQKFNEFISQESTFNTSQILYDLVVYSEWEERELQHGDSAVFSISLNLLEPEFNSKVFARWDSPGFLTIQNDQMFPNDFTTTIELNNSVQQNISINKIEYSSEGVIEISGENGISFSDNNPQYLKVSTDAKIIYDELVENLSIKFYENDLLVDEISRTVYVPATPYSETGLEIVNDSVSLDNLPEVEIFFSVKNQEKGYFILNLEQENIFLYENGNRVEDFNLGKHADTGFSLVDVVFVLDVSGSMGNEIDAVRNNLNEFGDSLAAKGFDYQVGVVTFSTTVDNIWDLTSDLSFIESKLAGINLWGGIEDSPSALIAASELSFREGSKRTIIWITDEPYPEDNYTKQEVVDRMLEMGISVNGVGLVDLESDWFDPIIIGTGGNFYDINGNFRDILLDVSNIESQNVYKLSYTNNSVQSDQDEVKLEIRYAGLGGNKTFILGSGGLNKTSDEKLLSFYPNPFNPAITFEFSKQNIISGSLKIFNSIGQLVKVFEFNNSIPTVIWNARNMQGALVSSGMYIVTLDITDVNNIKHHETAKILYLK